MIKIPLTKILFLDIETVGIEKDYDTCLEKRPELAKQFDKYYDWFLKRFPEDKEIEVDQKNIVFASRTALVPEFAKIVCMSVAFVMDNGDIKKQTFFGDNERFPPRFRGVFTLWAEQVFQAQFRLGGRNHIPQRLGQTQRPQRPRHMAKLHRPVALLDLPVGGHGHPHDPGHILLQ